MSHRPARHDFMNYNNILITGGAGFVGSNLAVMLKDRFPAARVTALDNLRRRGSELNLPRFREAGVQFAHADIRNPEDLVPPADPYDLLIECSAEPSVLAGHGSDPRYVINTNLAGTVNCLELARACKADVVFLSTSRVYPIGPLCRLNLRETDTRFELLPDQPVRGVGPDGVTEDFPLTGHRSLYGATKLASELLIEEYRYTYGLRAVVNRCGVLAGPWQMGKVDQGVFTLWVLAHHFGRPLKYVGFGGTGKQVRDLLHVADLFDLLVLQFGRFPEFDGSVFNVGGGRPISLSLRETTDLCARVVGRRLDVAAEPQTRFADLPVYLTDTAAVRAATGWVPRRGPAEILTDIHAWVVANEKSLRGALG